jgi:hypothetical protein
MTLRARAVVLTWVAAAAGLAGGCTPTSPTLYPVSGRVLVDGKPAARAMVALHPTGSSTATPQRLPVGLTDADGAFRLTTNLCGDGAPPGTYAVTVVWPDPHHEHDECEDDSLDDQLLGQFADPRNPPLIVVVRPGNNRFTLQLASRGQRPDS